MPELPDILQRTSAQWASIDPFLPKGMLAIESDTGRKKLGTGQRYSSTSYVPDETTAELPLSGSEGDVLTYVSGAWSAAAPTSGGSGDYLPLAGGTMTGNIEFDGTSGQYLGKGSFDTSRGGNYGISLVCSVGYEMNWQAGYLIATEQDHLTPRPLYLDGEAGTTLRVWDSAENEGVEISHTGVTFADGTTQTTAADSLPASATEGDVLTYSSGSWAAAAPSGGGSLPNGSNNGDVLTWNSTAMEWQAGAVPTELPGGMGNGDVLTWNTSLSAWQSAAIPSQLPTSASSNDILAWNGSQWAAVMPSTPGLPSGSQGQFLKYDGTNWVAASLTSTASGGQFLQYDGSNWVAAAFTISDYSASAGYGVGDLVTHQNTIWRATNTGMGNEPGYGSSYWVNLSVLDIPQIQAPLSPSDGDVLTWSAINAAWESQPPSGGGGGATEQYMRVTSDEGTSYTAASSLSLPLQSGGSYIVEGVAALGVTSSWNFDVQLALKLLATADGDVFLDHETVYSSPGSPDRAGGIITDQDMNTAVYEGALGENQVYRVRFRAVVEVSPEVSSTNVTLWHGNTSNGDSDSFLKAGSWMSARVVSLYS